MRLLLPGADQVAAAAAVLRAGLLVGLPTDTVYGLAADLAQPAAIDLVFAAKARPRTLELPVLVADVDAALALSGAVSLSARRLMARYWPGPLTLVLPRRPGLAAHLGSNDATIGVRCPDHAVTLAVCRTFGPIATTSANRHGQPPATTAAELAAAVPDVELIVDGGLCAAPPSTVVDCTTDRPTLLRAGSLPWPEVLAHAVSD